MVNGIITFIKTVFAVLLKVIAWLLFALGLWLPFVYAFVFLIVCALTGANLMQQMRLFVTGLVLATIGGLALSYYIAEWKRKKKKAERAKKKGKGFQSDVKNKKVGQSETLQNEYPVLIKDKSFAQSNDFTNANPMTENVRKGKDTVKNTAKETSAAVDRVEPISSVQERSADVSVIQSAWSNAKNEPIDEKVDVKQAWKRSADASDIERYEQKYLSAKSEVQAERLKSVDDEVKTKWDRIHAEAQRPLVYRSKTDPSIYIYEFVDCFHFYRRAGDEMEYIGARAKGI